MKRELDILEKYIAAKMRYNRATGSGLIPSIAKCSLFFQSLIDQDTFGTHRKSPRMSDDKHYSTKIFDI